MWPMGRGMRTSSRGRGRPKGKGREGMEREVPSVLLLLCKNEALLAQLEDGYSEQ